MSERLLSLALLLALGANAEATALADENTTPTSRATHGLAAQFLAVVAVVLALAALVAFVLRRRRSKQETDGLPLYSKVNDHAEVDERHQNAAAVARLACHGGFPTEGFGGGAAAPPLTLMNEVCPPKHVGELYNIAL